MDSLLKLLYSLKLLKAKKRQEIRRGKLWEITRVRGRDISEVEVEVAKPEPFKRPEVKEVGALKINIITGENNKSNLTKNPDLM